MQNRPEILVPERKARAVLAVSRLWNVLCAVFFLAFGWTGLTAPGGEGNLWIALFIAAVWWVVGWIVRPLSSRDK